MNILVVDENDIENTIVFDDGVPEGTIKESLKSLGFIKLTESGQREALLYEKESVAIDRDAGTKTYSYAQDGTLAEIKERHKQLITDMCFAYANRTENYLKWKQGKTDDSFQDWIAAIEAEDARAKNLVDNAADANTVRGINFSL